MTADSLVLHLLESTPEKACMQCLKDHGIVRNDVSHGYCYRHFLAKLEAEKDSYDPMFLSLERAKAKVKPASYWAPDLGPVMEARKKSSPPKDQDSSFDVDYDEASAEAHQELVSKQLSDSEDTIKAIKKRWPERTVNLIWVTASDDSHTHYPAGTPARFHNLQLTLNASKYAQYDYTAYADQSFIPGGLSVAMAVARNYARAFPGARIITSMRDKRGNDVGTRFLESADYDSDYEDASNEAAAALPKGSSDILRDIKSTRFNSDEAKFIIVSGYGKIPDRGSNANFVMPVTSPNATGFEVMVQAHTGVMREIGDRYTTAEEAMKVAHLAKTQFPSAQIVTFPYDGCPHNAPKVSLESQLNTLVSSLLEDDYDSDYADAADETTGHIEELRNILDRAYVNSEDVRSIVVSGLEDTLTDLRDWNDPETRAFVVQVYDPTPRRIKTFKTKEDALSFAQSLQLVYPTTPINAYTGGGHWTRIKKPYSGDYVRVSEDALKSMLIGQGVSAQTNVDAIEVYGLEREDSGEVVDRMAYASPNAEDFGISLHEEGEGICADVGTYETRRDVEAAVAILREWWPEAPVLYED